MKYSGLSAAQAQHLRQGGGDALGRAAEHAVSDGGGMPCRHCLRNIPKGRGYLIAAHKPFEGTHAYTETGPIFLCAEECERPGGALPEVLATSPDYLLKGYTVDERIIYGTGQITAAADIPAYAGALLARGDVAFVDVRSARNNCWQVRITRD